MCLILSGWGLSPAWQNNAIALANPVGFLRLWREYPHAVLATTPTQQWATEPISSELQHATLGSGRWILSDAAEIRAAIKSGEYQRNPVLVDAVALAAQKHRPIHLLGHPELVLASLGLTHDTPSQPVFLHLFYSPDRDHPQALSTLLTRLADELTHRHSVLIASIISANDVFTSDRRSPKLLRAYRTMVLGEGLRVRDPIAAINQHYQAGGTDHNLPPLSVTHAEGGPVQDRDIVILAHPQASEITELIRAFLDSSALRPLVRRQAPLRKLLKFVSLVTPNLTRQLGYDIAFPPAQIRSTLPEILAGRGLRQARIFPASATDAMTTYFSGGRTTALPGEERINLDDKKSDVGEIVHAVGQTLTRNSFDFVVVNINHVDRVAEQAEILATAAAVRQVDVALQRISQLVLGSGGTLLVTSDHGHAEALRPKTRTHYHVPLLLVRTGKERNLIRQAVTLPPMLAATLARPSGSITDVAPTILDLFGIPTPVEMTGASLLPQLE